MKRDHWQREIARLDPAVDFAEIYRIMGAHEFPYPDPGARTALIRRLPARREPLYVHQRREFAIYPHGDRVEELGTFPERR